MIRLLILVGIVTLMAFFVCWREKALVKKRYGVSSERYHKISRTKRILGVVCLIAFVLGGLGSLKFDSQQKTAIEQVRQERAATAQEKISEDKKEKKQLQEFKKSTKVKDLMNGFRNKKVGVYSVYETTSDEFDKNKDLWLLKWAQKKVDSKEWNFAVVLFKDKPSYGAIYNGLFTVGCVIHSDEYGDYSMGQGGDVYIEDDTNPGHLKKVALDK